MKRYDKKFFWIPLFCCCFWIRDPGWVKIMIRDQHPVSATLFGPWSDGPLHSWVPAAPLLIILSLLLLLAGLQVLLVAGEVGQEALDAAHAHLHQPWALDTGVQPSTRHLGYR